jgi:hypothetical protein
VWVNKRDGVGDIRSLRREVRRFLGKNISILGNKSSGGVQAGGTEEESAESWTLSVTDVRKDLQPLRTRRVAWTAEITSVVTQSVTGEYK